MAAIDRCTFYPSQMLETELHLHPPSSRRRKALAFRRRRISEVNTPLVSVGNQLNIKGHKRDDAATAYLGSLADAKVDLLVGCPVQKLHIENGRCMGVRLIDPSSLPGDQSNSFVCGRN